jgi:hypothetical protein
MREVKQEEGQTVKTKREVFTVMKIQVMVFWVMTPCNDVVGYQRFGEPGNHVGSLSSG